MQMNRHPGDVQPPRAVSGVTAGRFGNDSRRRRDSSALVEHPTSRRQTLPSENAFSDTNALS